MWVIVYAYVCWWSVFCSPTLGFPVTDFHLSRKHIHTYERVPQIQGLLLFPFPQTAKKERTCWKIKSSFTLLVCGSSQLFCACWWIVWMCMWVTKYRIYVYLFMLRIWALCGLCVLDVCVCLYMHANMRTHNSPASDYESPLWAHTEPRDLLGFRGVEREGCRQYESCHFTLVQSGPPQQRQNKSVQHRLSYHTRKQQELRCNYSWGFTTNSRNFCIKSVRVLTVLLQCKWYLHVDHVWVIFTLWVPCFAPYCINSKKNFLVEASKACKPMQWFFFLPFFLVLLSPGWFTRHDGVIYSFHYWHTRTWSPRTPRMHALFIFQKFSMTASAKKELHFLNSSPVSSHSD